MKTFRRPARAWRSLAADSVLAVSWAKSGETAGDTRIFITTGFAFEHVDLLVTNFHLPKSTLMMLVSAFGGLEHVLAAYNHAVQSGYRFFSYGDCMLVD